MMNRTTMVRNEPAIYYCYRDYHARTIYFIVYENC